MKRIACWLVLALVSSASIAHTHKVVDHLDDVTEPLKVVYHLNEKEKTTLLISSVKQLLTSNPNADIKIIIQGAAIIKLAKTDRLRHDFRALLDHGVAIGACSAAILKNEIKPDLMLEGVELLIDGGIQRILQLQAQGYGYIKI